MRNDGVFLTYLKNSIVTTVVTMIVVAIVSLLAGYAFSKLKVAGGRIWMLLIIAALMIPFQTLMIPLYSIMANLHLTNTRLSMILISAEWFNFMKLRDAARDGPMMCKYPPLRLAR